jgi:hypothetical protein
VGQSAFSKSDPAPSSVASQKTLQQIENYFHSHPPTAERLKRLEAIERNSMWNENRLSPALESRRCHAAAGCDEFRCNRRYHFRSHA